MYQGLDELEHLLDRELALDDAFPLDEVAHLLHGPVNRPLGEVSREDGFSRIRPRVPYHQVSFSLRREVEGD